MSTQAERTAATTERLLDATLAALIDAGYRGASTPEICRRAGVSRGAQLHHFRTKQELVAAAVEHLFTKRVADLERRIGACPTVIDLADAASFLWSVYTGDTYYAWLELVVASRTDAELRALVAAVDARLVARAERLCHAVLLPHVDDAREIAATTRLVLAIFDGLGTHQILLRDDEAARAVLRVAARAGLFDSAGISRSRASAARST